MLEECCRICVKSEIDLYDVFGGKIFEDDLDERIHTIFGVKISPEDTITKKICKACYYLTNSVYEQRLTAIRNDELLKEKYGKNEENTTSIENDANIPLPIPKEVEGVKSKKKRPRRSVWQTERKRIRKPRMSEQSEESTESFVPQDKFLSSLNLVINSKRSDCHPSILKIREQYPSLIIPDNCTNANLTPVVEIDSTLRTRGMPKGPGKWVLYRDSNSDFKYTFIHDVPKPKFGKIYSVKRLIESSVDHSYSKKSKTSVMNMEINTSHDIFPIDNELILVPPNDSITNNSKSGEEYSTDTSLITAGQTVMTFICQTCNKVFDAKRDLENHKKNGHKRSLRCSKCPKAFSVIEDLMTHNMQGCAPTTPDENSISKTVQNNRESSYFARTNIPVQEMENIQAVPSDEGNVSDEHTNAFYMELDSDYEQDVDDEEDEDDEGDETESDTEIVTRGFRWSIPRKKKKPKSKNSTTRCRDKSITPSKEEDLLNLEVAEITQCIPVENEATRKCQLNSINYKPTRVENFEDLLCEIADQHVVPKKHLFVKLSNILPELKEEKIVSGGEVNLGLLQEKARDALKKSLNKITGSFFMNAKATNASSEDTLPRNKIIKSHIIDKVSKHIKRRINTLQSKSAADVAAGTERNPDIIEVINVDDDEDEVPQSVVEPQYDNSDERTYMERIFRKYTTLDQGKKASDTWNLKNFKKLVQYNFVPVEFVPMKTSLFQINFAIHKPAVQKRHQMNGWDTSRAISAKQRQPQNDMPLLPNQTPPVQAVSILKNYNRVPNLIALPQYPNPSNVNAPAVVPTTSVIQNQQMILLRPPLSIPSTESLIPIMLPNVPVNQEQIVACVPNQMKTVPAIITVPANNQIMVKTVSSVSSQQVNNDITFTTTASKSTAAGSILKDYLVPPNQIPNSDVPKTSSVNDVQKLAQEGEISAVLAISEVNPDESNTEEGRPMIRLKPISELTDSGQAPPENDRRLTLHNLYIETLTKYVNSTPNSDSNAPINSTDEYMQIS